MSHHPIHSPAADPHQLIDEIGEMPNKYNYLAILRFLIDSSTGGDNLPEPKELADHIRSNPTPFLWDGPRDPDALATAVAAILRWAAEFDPRVHPFMAYNGGQTVWDGALHTLVHDRQVAAKVELQRRTMLDNAASVLTALPNPAWQGVRPGHDGEGRRRVHIAMGRRVHMTLAELGVFPSQKARRDAEEAEDVEEPGDARGAEEAGVDNAGAHSRAGTPVRFFETRSADERERSVADRAAALNYKEAELTARQAEHRRASAVLQAEQAELAKRVAAYQQAVAGLEVREAELTARTDAHQQAAADQKVREAQLTTRFDTHQQAVADLQAREAELLSRIPAPGPAVVGEPKRATHKTDLVAWERALHSQSESLHELRSQLDAKFESLHTEATHLGTRAEMLRTQQGVLDTRSKKLSLRDSNLTEHEIFVGRMQEELEKERARLREEFEKEKAEMVPRWLVQRIVNRLQQLHRTHITEYEKDVHEWAGEVFEAQAEARAEAQADVGPTVSQERWVRNIKQYKVLHKIELTEYRRPHELELE